ncbi:MAG: phosphoglycerate dehydrogenase [Burkholderiaceae bacterium]
MTYQIQILNNISEAGLMELPSDQYAVSTEHEAPDAIMVRSADMHQMPINQSVKAIARAGAGTNNIPVAAMSQRGIPVFNAPGANANAVKELVLAAMLMAARQLPAALAYVDHLQPDASDLTEQVENGKKAYGGYELAGRTIGIIGLGKIGCLVADAAIALGMKVVGYDPNITIDAAWNLSSQVKKAATIPELLGGSDFVSLHVPLVEATKDLIDAQTLTSIKPGAVVLNFSRAGVVSETAAIEALEAGRLSQYVCDFPTATSLQVKGLICLPHLGASTIEAEDNCARMVARQLRGFLEHGDVTNTVNFPTLQMPRESRYRLAIANANVPNMVGQISTQMADASLNIHTMINRSRDEVAYTVLDVNSPVEAEVIAALCAIDGVLSVRYLPTS